MYKQTNTICQPKRIRIFALIIICKIIMKTKSRFSRNVYAISDRVWCNKHLRHATTENMIMGKVDTSDLMMIISSAMDISSQSPKLKWASWTHTTQYIYIYIYIYQWKWKVIERTSSMLGTPPQDKLHKHLHISSDCEHSWIMMIRVGSKMYKIEYDLRAIMYPAYDKPHKQCNIRGNWNIQQPRLLPNNAGRPMRQFKSPHLAQVESRVTPSSIFVFSWGGKPAWGVHRPWHRDIALC